MADRTAELSPTEREALADGRHSEVAESLRSRQRADLAGWVLEQIWDWDAALVAYRDSKRRLDALRVALESGAAGAIDSALADIENENEPAVVGAAVELLERKRRPMEAARLMALGESSPRRRADALLRAGDRLAAARVLAQGGHPTEALETIAPSSESVSPAQLSLAAGIAWDLGDAEAAARYAQRALRGGDDEEETIALLARALGSLGHDLAAQMVLEGRTTPAGTGLPGRYRVTGQQPSGLIGAAYVGVDRLTLQEVELHLLLADAPEAGPIDKEITAAIERFAASAEAASRIGHPAIRPILRIEAHSGLLVLPRAEGAVLRSLIRPPGMLESVSRARGLIAFLLEGLAAAHGRGIVHGWLLPSQITCDAVGRPLLGPFGAHHLSGLAATHTGGLEEIIATTAPELRRAGTTPTAQTDRYAAGALLRGLLMGRLNATAQEASGTPELDLATALMHPDPDQRPLLAEALKTLRRPVADIRDLERQAPSDSMTGRIAREAERELEPGVQVTTAESWSDEALDALCRSPSAWMQPVLDRSERTLVLAPWPEGSRSLPGDAGSRWRDLLPADALDFEDEALREAIAQRLRPQSLVKTPSGAWMLALDDLLSR